MMIVFTGVALLLSLALLLALYRFCRIPLHHAVRCPLDCICWISRQSYLLLCGPLSSKHPKSCGPLLLYRLVIVLPSSSSKPLSTTDSSSIVPSSSNLLTIVCPSLYDPLSGVCPSSRGCLLSYYSTSSDPSSSSVPLFVRLLYVCAPFARSLYVRAPFAR